MADNIPPGPLFPPWTNTAVRATLLAVGLGAAGGIGLLLTWVRSPYFTGQHEPVVQPIEFDHRHHVADDGIDCRYCHTSVEKAASAGFPATEVCTSCHGQVWNQTPYLASIRNSFFADKSLEWKKVHQLPDHVYFNHSIHVAKGVGCYSCHGRIDQMAEVYRESDLTMGWCLDCHRNPTPNLRPREFITSMTWAAADPEATGREVAKQLGVHTRTSCSTCHR